MSDLSKTVFRLIIFNVLFLFGSCIVVLITGLSVGAHSAVYLLIIFLACFLTLVLFTFLLWLKSMYKYEFTSECINFLHGKRIIKRIDYSIIQGITICGAVDYYLSPIVDSCKKQKAVLSLYDSSTSFRATMHSKSFSIISSSESNRIMQGFLKKSDLYMVLMNTKTDVYITEEMYETHKSDLCDIFSEYKERIYLACNKPGLLTLSFTPMSDIQHHE